MKETIVKINKTKSWFFEKINKIDKPLARLIKNKRENSQINKIRNEKGEVTTDNAEIHRIIRDYYEQLYSNKMDNLKEMDRLLEKLNLTRLNQGEIEIMPPPARGAGTLIPSAQRLVWAAKQPLGNAALGALFA